MRIGAISQHSTYHVLRASVREFRKDLYAIFKKCEKAWEYIGKGIRISHLSLKAAFTSSDIKVQQAISGLKMFAVVSIPFAIASIPTLAQSIIKNIKQRDVEGGVLAGLSFVLLTGDLLDSIGTVVNASMSLAAQVPVLFFSVIAMPLSFGLVGLGTILRTIGLVKTQLLYNKFNSEVIDKIDRDRPDNQNLHKVLRDFLNKQLLGDKPLAEPLADEELLRLKEMKKAELQRAAPSDVVEKFEKIFAMLEQKSQLKSKQVKEILSDLDQIGSSLRKKRAIDIGNLIANVFTVVGLCLLITGLPAPIGIVLLVVAIAIRINLLIYRDVDIS